MNWEHIRRYDFGRKCWSFIKNLSPENIPVPKQEEHGGCRALRKPGSVSYLWLTGGK